MKVVVLLVALALVPACGHDSPTAPTPAFGPRTGTWAGPVTDDINGSGTMRIELTELTIDTSRSLLGGAWTTTFADPSKNATGTVGGILSGSQLSITANPMPAVSLRAAPLRPAGDVLDHGDRRRHRTGRHLFVQHLHRIGHGHHHLTSPVTPAIASPRSPRRPAAAPPGP